MAVVIPFLLPPVLMNAMNNSPVNVTIASLFNPMPAYQTNFSLGSLTFVAPNTQFRNETVPSFGFPHTPLANFTPGSPSPIYYIPQNAFAVVSPSQLGPVLLEQLDINAKTIISILLLDVDVAPVQPGISRLQISFTAADNSPQVLYYDMPFYENLDVHSSDIQSIVDYIQEVAKNSNLRTWISNTLTLDEFESRHIFKRGLSVSGGVRSTQATTGVSNILTAHSLPIISTAKSLRRAMLSQLSPSAPEKFVPYIPQTTTFTEGITASQSTYAPGDSIILFVTGPLDTNDKITLLDAPLPTQINLPARTYRASIPRSIAYTATIPVFISNNGIKKSPSLSLTVKANPKVHAITGPNNIPFGSPGDQIILTGTDFGGTAGTIQFSKITVSNAAFTPSAAIVDWTDTQIIAILPLYASSGAVALTTSGGQATTSQFTINYPLFDNTFVVNPSLFITTTTSPITAQAYYNDTPVAASWSIITDTMNIGLGNVSNGTIDKNGIYTPPPLVATPLVLSLVANYRGQFGSYNAQASVMVFPNSRSSLTTVNPTMVTIQPSFTQRFVLIHNGLPLANSAVTWYVNGIAGGNAQYGFIGTNGIYTAPNIIPRVQSVYVTGFFVASGIPFSNSAVAKIG